MENKDHKPLQRIGDNKNVLESDSSWIEGKESEKPRDSKQRKNDRGGLDTSFDFLYLCLVLNVSRPHHLTNN